MRITTKMISSNYLSDATRNLNNLQTLTQQLTTGKLINKPSDNPYKVARSMQLHTDINTNTQYNTNISDTINWLDTTDESLDQATGCIERIRTLMVSAGNAAYGTNERKAIADEVNERISELAQILNGNFNGKYIFGGTKTSSTPVDVQKDANGNNYIVYSDSEGNEILDPANSKDVENMGKKVSVEISQGVTIEYNVTVSDVLNYETEAKDANGNKYDVMGLLSEIVTNLTSDNIQDSKKITNENLDEIDKVLTNLLAIRAEVGAKQNRMESAKSKNEDDSFNMTEILSKNEDIDFTEKTIEYSTAQTIYQACLQVSGQILPQSLLDYL